MPLKQATFNFDFEAGPEKQTEPVRPPVPEAVHAVPSVETSRKSNRGRMKISDMKACVDKLEIPDDEKLFEKSYYSIGAVCEMFKVNPSLIRFWESEFEIINPKKNGKGDRFFRPADVKNLRIIYHLLREKKYTIEGAKEYLRNSKRFEEKFEMIESLKRIKNFLTELKMNL